MLCDRVESGSLHWRHYNIAIGMLGVLTRYDEPMPPRVARLFVGNLVHENLTVRKGALHIVECVLKQQKRKHPKMEIK